MSDQESPPELMLGIDIGTSNVKMVLVEKGNLRVVCDPQTKPLGPHVNSPVENAYERSVKSIFSCIKSCMECFDSELLQNVCSIGVCGQMHGCVMWNSNATLSTLLNTSDINYRYHFSNLITWQDGRCVEGFLYSLPQTQQAVGVSTGYGCATLAWLQRFHPELIERYDRAGTIMDLLVWLLCGGSKKKVVMSAQNATSWGYFDIEKQRWEKELLEGTHVQFLQKQRWERDLLEGTQFPTHLLPDVVPAPAVAGKLHQSWYSVREGTTIGVAMGDLQCSIFAAQPEKADAVLNFGSASQLAVIKPRSDTTYQPTSILHHPPPSLMEVPYFGGDTLLVAAALAGGNVVATFVGMLQSWMKSLGVQDIPKEDDIHEKLILLAETKSDTSLQVDVTLWGERHLPNARGSVCNMEPNNLSLEDVSCAMFRGIMENLRSMMPPGVFQELQIKRVIGSGSTLQRNAVLQKHAEGVFNLPLIVKEGIDAPLGAAMALQSLKL